MPSLSDELANAYSAPNQLPLRPVRRALISVSDKSGIAEFAKALHDRGVALLSTGGTAKLIAENGLPVTEVSQHTGFPEMMDGRVKTLHPKIHGGLLGRRDMDEAIMAEHGIDPIDMLIVNLYPFESTVADSNCPLPLAIENIDIGGPAMLRAAAKNNDGAAVVVDPNDYENLLAEMDANDNQLTGATRFKLAAKTYALTAAYDGAIANYMGRIADDGAKRDWPDTFNTQFELEESLRYGENPHQKAAFFKEAGATEPAIGTAKQIQGKALSYNNLADADAALECVKAFPEAPACVIVKHANPCGVALGDNLLQAYELAFQTDPTSAFGGIIAFNQALDAETAKAIIDRQFVEVIIAPSVNTDAAEVLSAKANVRVLETGQWADAVPSFDFKRINGGLLVQDRDLGAVNDSDLKVVTKRAPTDDEMRDLKFVWRVAKFVKSNAIVYAKGQQTIGVGAGQMSRVYSAKIAGIKAGDEGLEVPGSVLASDAFFPFRDGVDAAAAAGITAMIQPGGSIRDDEVIAAADEANIAMVFTGMRHFRH